MERICSYCRKGYGERCGKCGSVNVEKNARGRWVCADCKSTWAPGSQPQTHGVCEDCETVLLSKRAA